MPIDSLDLILEIVSELVGLPGGEAVPVVATKDEVVLQALTLEEVVSLESLPGNNSEGGFQSISSEVMLEHETNVILILDLGIKTGFQVVFSFVAPHVIQLFLKFINIIFLKRRFIIKDI